MVIYPKTYISPQHVVLDVHLWWIVGAKRRNPFGLLRAVRIRIRFLFANRLSLSNLQPLAGMTIAYFTCTTHYLQKNKQNTIIEPFQKTYYFVCGIKAHAEERNAALQCIPARQGNP